jgi:hypothetical protein
MYQVISGPSVNELTTRTVGGSGVFDALMASVSAHLAGEYAKNRITGSEYSKVYIELTQAVLQASVQFTLGKDAAFWAAQKAQVEAINGAVQIEATRVALAKTQFDALTSKAGYVLASMKSATESIQYCIAKYQLENILPAQKTLVQEQAEVQHAQTSATRLDGHAVDGLVAKQWGLYNQQIISYQRDAEVKAAKMFADAWMTQKTIDEGLAAPTGFTNASLDTVLTAIKTANGFV